MQSFRRNQKTPFQGIRNANQNKTNRKLFRAKTTKTHAPIDNVDYISSGERGLRIPGYGRGDREEDSLAAVES